MKHRDLHWGQILVKHTEDLKEQKSRRSDAGTAPKSQRAIMDDPGIGIKATIIDLGLARIDRDDDVYWTPFDDDIHGFKTELVLFGSAEQRTGPEVNSFQKRRR